MKERTFTGTTDQTITDREIRHRAVACRAAAEGMVLLKNENQTLPLDPGSAVALYGVGAVRTIKGGTGSGDVNERERVSIYQGMKNAGYLIANEASVLELEEVYQKARDTWRDDILDQTKEMGMMDFFGIYSSNPFQMPSGGSVEKADTDTAIFVLSRVAGENADRYCAEGDYYLSREESGQLDQICRLYETVIVVINAGGQVDLSFMDTYPNIRALLYIVQPGMEGGNAFADVISGRVTPSGKLTDTWAYQYEDYPNSENFSHNNGDVDTEKYEEDIYVGYRYFDTYDVPVRYGFGYGLSYTTFDVQYTDAALTKEEICVTASVTNTGNTDGKEIVQVYASCPPGRLEKEYRRLAGFAKTKDLQPQESESDAVHIPIRSLASYDEQEPGWVLEPGYYGIWVGTSLADAEPVCAMHVAERVVLERTVNICPLKEELNTFHPDAQKAQKRYAVLKQKTKEKDFPVLELACAAIPTNVIDYRPNRELVPEKAAAFVNQLSTDQLIQLATGDPGKGQGSNLGAAGISVPGSAGETSDCAKDRDLASIVLADGPAGLRLMKYYYVEDGAIVSMPFEFSLEGGLFCPQAEQMSGERYYQYCTAIPVGTLLAQSWDEELLREVGEMIGHEMEEFHVTLWLAPGMNIHRNPLCGRNFEYYSEDPLVTGRMAAAMTQGVQSVPGCGTTIKHFACNNQEDNRMGSNSVLSERALREIYLRGFEIAVRTAQPLSIMTSYNLINGVHAANNFDTCTQAARNEWGFQGVIMTDWTTTMVDESCTASGCMRAGNDLVMPGCQGDHDNMRRELEQGTLSIEDLKACVGRLVNVIWQSGWY